MELGRIQKLNITRKTDNGLYLNTSQDNDEKDVLLPNNQVPQDKQIGDELEVFIYKDSQDRIIATRKKPKITLGSLAKLNVVDIAKFGAFLDWGLDKDLFLPFSEHVGKVVKGGTYLVGLYIDKSQRLCATMKISGLLTSQSPFKENERVKGTVYNIHCELGAFVAVEDKYVGLIPKKELFGSYSVGDKIELRIIKVKSDGKLELAIRNKAYHEIEGDAKKIMENLMIAGGTLSINDNSSPEEINTRLNMSKSAFKRALGRLLKEGAIKIKVHKRKRSVNIFIVIVLISFTHY